MALPTIGQTISEKYRLDELIGEGGFAGVYRATDVTIGRRVAVKITRRSSDESAVVNMSRFAREARAVASLSDPHTVRMFDFGRTGDGLLFMVFELLRGEDLAQLLEADGPLDEAVTVHIAKQVLLSLREAHANDLLHRDIKPSNIRVFDYQDEPHYVKLMDFGIVASLDPEGHRLTQTGQQVGTPRYMSPEQLMGARLSPASDIYSLGLVMHEMLTLASDAPVEAILAGKDIEVPGSRALARVLNRMIRQDARARFQSADEALRALDALGGGAPSPPTLIEERADVAPTPSKRSAAPIFLGLALGLVAIAGVWATSQRQPSAEGATDLKHVLRTQPGPMAKLPAKPDPGLESVGATNVADGCGSKPAHVGDVARSSLEGLRKSSWVTYIPSDYDPNERHPLVLAFGGSNLRPEDVLTEFAIRELADAKQFVVVSPQPPTPALKGGYTWLEDVDVGPIAAAVEGTRKELCIEADRIFAIGHGTGAWPVEAATCEPWLAAAMTSSARLQTMTSFCPPGRATPRLIYSPSDAPMLPLNGGTSCAGFAVRPLHEYEDFWRSINTCDGEARVQSRRGKSVCRTWDCETPLTSCVVDGGFFWQSAVPRPVLLPKCEDKGSDYPYLEETWAFFERVSSDRRLPEDPGADEESAGQ